MTLAKSSLPTPPSGYKLVFDGIVRKGDLAHSDTNEWNPPGKHDFTSIGKCVQSYYAIARPMRPAK
ncbi:hypothetical protein RBE51_21115 [Pseudomonas taiwanensis]|uniref:hypothetical protein n=1 Tax=Pseudomonas taiwanensis TaxID=470150 RepID=UPI0028DE34B5|nr:hypothetical protein [Pseudomonas taiwanensis]MDT8925298.1 hypothetical protein [Pseudomonas taiwanensis]